MSRALAVLELLMTRATPLTMSEIATEIGIAKSSLHHILNELIERDWVERDPVSMRISLGLRAWELGRSPQRLGTLSQRAQAQLDEVRDQLGETVRLAVLSGTDNVCIAKSAGKHTLVFDQPIGARLPAYATGLGKALLSGLDRDQLDDRYRSNGFELFTERTVTSVDELWRDLERVKKRGYAEDNGEFILGIHCVAVPIRGAEGSVIAAISVSVPSSRWDAGRHRSTVDTLAAATLAISQRLPKEVELV